MRVKGLQKYELTGEIEKLLGQSAQLREVRLIQIIKVT